MGGGLFGTPLALNEKCLVFSTFVLLVWFMPHPSAWQHQIVIGFFLATLSYILLAWYDFLYDCNDHLKPTLLGWLSKSFKPEQYQKDFDNLPLKYKKIVRQFDIFILVLLLGLAFSPYIIFH